MLKSTDPSALTSLVNDVLSGSKYSAICPDLVRRIAEQELSKRHNAREALKATRSKLHQVGGAYLDGRREYAQWFAALQTAKQTGNDEDFKQACRKIMASHTSTRERLPILDQFYTTLLSDLPPIHSVLDIACGLNPLAIPWMFLAADVHYDAYDIYQDMIDFLHHFMTLIQLKGHTQTCDIVQSIPTRQVDLALILKVLPCLEQLDKQAGYHLLHALHARFMIVSFPVHSLGGRKKGMTHHYEARFHELIGEERWEVRRFEFATELVFVVKK